DHSDEARRYAWMGAARQLAGAKRSLLPGRGLAGLAAGTRPAAAADTRARIAAALAAAGRRIRSALERVTDPGWAEDCAAAAGGAGVSPGDPSRAHRRKLVALLRQSLGRVISS